jgi:hypothetical protein
MVDEKFPIGDQSKADELEERLIDFAVRIVNLSASLPKTAAGKHIAGQILRSGTSPALTMVKQEELKATRISFTNYESS